MIQVQALKYLNYYKNTYHINKDPNQNRIILLQSENNYNLKYNIKSKFQSIYDNLR